MFLLSTRPLGTTVRSHITSSTYLCIRRYTIMGDNNTSKTQAGVGADKKPKPSKREVRILMLHGYTQSGPLFHSKTRALEKLLVKSLAPLNLAPILIYPTAPNRLRPRDIPGYQAKEDEDSDSELDSWAWWRRDEASGAFRFLKEGMLRVAETIKENVGHGGKFDGVVGFSQGGALAAMLAAALERERELPGGEEGGWVKAVRDANGGVPLKFSVIYSGFCARPEELQWLYEPKIATPTLHFIGGLDTVVDESWSQRLVDKCIEPTVYTHPGGHHVPVSKEWAMPLIAFIRKCVEEKEEGKSAL